MSIPICIQVATVLWRFGNSHVPFRLAEVLLGISTGSYRNFTECFFTALNERHKHQIHWPTTQEELNATMGGFARIDESEFETSLRLPNVIGAMDGKLVRIHKPSDEPGTVWIDRKSHYSMSLLAVCDHKCKFTYVHTGGTGRCHDARTFNRSSLSTRLDSLCPDGSYILADQAYPLRKNIMVPYFRNNATPSQKRFNKVLSSSRMSIERAFGLLTCRWRFLREKLYVEGPFRMANIITACCILHNMCIDNSDIEIDGYNLLTAPLVPTTDTTLDSTLDGSNQNNNRVRQEGVSRREELRLWVDGQSRE